MNTDKGKLTSENWPVVRDELKKSAFVSTASGDNNHAINSESNSLSCGFVSSYLKSTEKELKEAAPFEKNALISFLLDQLPDIDFGEDFNCLTSNLSQAQDEITTENINEKIADLPKEWNVIQIVQIKDRYMGYATREDVLTNSSPIKFTLFRYNSSSSLKNRPLDVVLELKETGKKSLTSMAYEINYIHYKRYSQNQPSEHVEYIKMLTALQSEIINSMILWLGPWITLFSGKCKTPDGKQLEKKLSKEVDEFVTETDGISDENIVLLKLIVRRIDLLDEEKLKEAAYQLAQNKIQYQRITQFLNQLKKKTTFASNTYYPCILIIDEILDAMPWEMILPQQESTRFSSIHLLLNSYRLYKDQIEDGYVKLQITNGSALINPDNDEKLQKMHLRMDEFYKTWRPDWKRHGATIPTTTELRSLFQDYDVFVYSGHGSALQFFDAKDDITLKTKSVLLLFGCESLALKSRGLVSEAYGPSHVYYTTDCPGMLGATTIITDIWADLITIMILYQWIPSESTEQLNLNVGNDSYYKNRIKEILSSTAGKREPSLLAILSKIRTEMQLSVRIRSALVFRGLPVYNILAES